jgi:hypothetical protein
MTGTERSHHHQGKEMVAMNVLSQVTRVAVSTLSVLLCSSAMGCAADAGEDEPQAETNAEAQALTALEYDLATEKAPVYVDGEGVIDRNWGRSFFQADGDKIWIRDKATDGQSVGVHWKTSDGRQGICRNTKGADAWYYGCNKNFSERAIVWIRMGRCDGSVHSCRALSHYADWTGWEAI